VKWLSVSARLLVACQMAGQKPLGQFSQTIAGLHCIFAAGFRGRRGQHRANAPQQYA
jgi:hypothetical protein